MASNTGSTARSGSSCPKPVSGAPAATMTAAGGDLGQDVPTARDWV